ncbi:hypothetical protein MNBD_GAMMA22-33 [hydrothermal vent metagenome]|uniref:Fe2OG dioxygenase domain-containing protein n=1 Tax=hydrothermal vent metagenome TaxID=652676 RepID=A0A3B1AN25_9ZZZZ
MINSKLKLEKITNTIFRYYVAQSTSLNSVINEKFLNYVNEENTRKSHFFEGRHENIYISSELISEIKTVLNFGKLCVEEITGETPSQSGLWFNYMQPGHVTLAHSHDEADEIYSAVYYVRVPKNSGDLIITEDNKDITIHPKEGTLVLFPPSLVHHVTVNNSKSARLSVGINIGH